MSNDVWCTLTLSKLRTNLHCLLHGEFQPCRHSWATHSSTRPAGKQRLVRSGLGACEPPPNFGHRGSPQRQTAFLSSLAADTYRRAGVQDHIGDLQTGNFRDPATGVIEHRKHNAVSVAAPGSSVRGIENGLHLGSREK